VRYTELVENVIYSNLLRRYNLVGLFGRRFW
jgi:hypothetical protein